MSCLYRRIHRGNPRFRASEDALGNYARRAHNRIGNCGITFDINDLGLFAGITFPLLLLWLIVSLRREAENMRALFAETSDDELPAVYRLISMTQVFSVPPKITDKPTFAASLWKLPKSLLFVAPAGVQTAMAWLDWSTLPWGRTLNPLVADREV